MSTATCYACEAPVPSPSGGSGFAFCGKCGAPRFFGDSSSPFDVLGAPRRFELDETELQERYYDLSKRLHPDRHASSGMSAKIKIQELAAALNQAYLGLRNPEARLESLLKSAKGLSAEPERSGSQGQIPAALAEEYFELQEALMEEEARAAALAAEFRERVEAERAALTARMYEEARTVDWNAPDKPDSRARIEKILELRRQRSYVRSMLENLERHGA